MYGWHRDEILERYSFEEIEIFYNKGLQFDEWRRGFDVEREGVTEKKVNKKELVEKYFTPEEIKQNEKYRETLK